MGSIQESNDKASDTFPSVLVDGHLVHVFQRDSEWCVWVNTEDMDFTGLCIGVGTTRDKAVQQAVTALEAITAHLQELT